MLRKMVLAGLMGATLLSGIAPAYAQAWQDGGNRGGREQRAARPQGNMAWTRPDRTAQPQGDNANRGQSWQRRGDAGEQQRWQQRPAPQPGNQQPAMQQPAGQMAPPRPDARWRGDPSLPANRDVERQVRERREREQQQNWRNDQRNDRQDWRNDRRDDRQDWRSNRRDDDRRGNDNRDWNRDRDRNDGRWNNDNRNGGWNNGGWNNGRRYDDRTRWSNQRRWDNGWRQDRRYDWNSYRNRYGDRYRMGRYYAPRGWDYGYRRFSVGIFLNNMLYSNSYWLDDPYSYRLPPAYGTLRWVRYYDDALLVDIRDGYVVDVIHDFFW
ncbi:RcnB family protein [Sphingobium sp.]|uniref:RcnB family protein n=1 Tax=Sphingobium sp. TaxID=1912891 RepID=UPI002630BE66|nr:RcnB family protein [Sphingobium sp.]